MRTKTARLLTAAILAVFGVALLAFFIKERDLRSDSEPNPDILRRYDFYIDNGQVEKLKSRSVWSKEYLGGGRFVANRGRAYSEVGFRYRGNAYGRGGFNGDLPNKSFKFRFEKGNKLYGRMKVLNLLAIYKYGEKKSAAFRAKLPFDFLDAAGLPAPRTRWAELYINEQYQGLFMEKEDMDNKEFLGRWFERTDGPMYKFEKVTVGENGKRRYWREINIENERGISEFKRFMEIVQGHDKKRFFCEIPTILDIHHFLKQAALLSILSVSDLYGYGTRGRDKISTHQIVENQFLYYDATRELFVVLPWDLNSCLSRVDIGLFPKYFYRGRLLGYILENPKWNEAYRDYLKGYLNTVATERNIEKMIMRTARTVAPALKRHNKRWSSVYGYYDLDAEMKHVSQFLAKRRANIQKQLEAN